MSIHDSLDTEVEVSPQHYAQVFNVSPRPSRVHFRLFRRSFEVPSPLASPIALLVGLYMCMMIVALCGQSGFFAV